MSVVIFLAAAVILAGVIVVAMGRGGELARERPDPSTHADFRTWSDVARYRPPAALLGYHARATEHALSLIARTIAERDAEIDWLRKRLAEARPEFGPDNGSPAGADGAYLPAPVAACPAEPDGADMAEQDGTSTAEPHPAGQGALPGAQWQGGGVLDAAAVPDGVLDVAVVPDGVLDVAVVPDGVLDAAVVPDGVLDAVAVPDGVLDAAGVPDGVLDAAAVPDGVLDPAGVPAGFPAQQGLGTRAGEDE